MIGLRAEWDGARVSRCDGSYADPSEAAFHLSRPTMGMRIRRTGPSVLKRVRPHSHRRSHPPVCTLIRTL